jgi:CRISPR system Cascade subunit CasC
MLIEIHILQNHAPSNLNRDDSGSPKSCNFGEIPRARISSQCLKRTVRRSDLFREAMEGHLATRTRRMPRNIQQRFAADAQLSEYAEIAAQKASGFGTSDGKERAKNPKTGEYETAQTMFLTPADENAVFELLARRAREAGSVKAFKDLKAADLQKEARQGGFRPLAVDVAMFGRMVTSEAFRDVEASTQVAHALSTNKVSREFDYFTAMDDLQGMGDGEEDAGADMIGDVEFNSACYYKYFSIHPDALIDNLVGAEFRGEISAEARAAATDLAARAVTEFLRASILISPTGKQNSFAAHQLPYAVLVEVRPNALPISYANAFVAPARATGGKSLTQDSFEKLAKHVEKVTDKFSLKSTNRFLLVEDDDCTIGGVDAVVNLDTLCDRVGAAVSGTEVGHG